MDSEMYGVKRDDIDDVVADGEHCAICGTDEEKLLEVAVIDEDECVLVCNVCLKKHGVSLDEESDGATDEIEQPDDSEADGGMHEDMQ